MPYKSKRTRDLQGEVVAGTGITITEHTKPDGTKEYTIINGDPASAITVDGTGLSLISNVLRNTMAAIMGWSRDDERGAINWTDDNGDTVLKIIPLEELFIGDAHDNNDFIIKHINGENRLIRGTLQIAESINSTGGVALNDIAKLMDLSLSAMQYELGITETTDSGDIYLLGEGYNEVTPAAVDPQGNNYYNEGEFTLAGTLIKGVQVAQAGIYEITLDLGIDIATTSAADLSSMCVLKVISYLTGDSDIAEISVPAEELDTNQYHIRSSYHGFVDLLAGEILTYVLRLDSFVNVYDSYGTLHNPYFSIRKIR